VLTSVAGLTASMNVCSKEFVRRYQNAQYRLRLRSRELVNCSTPGHDTYANSVQSLGGTKTVDSILYRQYTAGAATLLGFTHEEPKLRSP